MINLLRYLFFLLVIKPFIFIVLGLNVRNRERLPKQGPAIIIANHNSHLDTLVLMSLLPLSELKKIHPVAAADYFLKNKWLSWFSQKIIGIIPIERKSVIKKENPLEKIQQALNRKNIIIFFPEGSRGEPEKMTELKKGIGHLAKKNPNIPIYPVFLYGLGKSLPKGETILVPFIVDVFIGESIYFQGEVNDFITYLNECFINFRHQVHDENWF